MFETITHSHMDYHCFAACKYFHIMSLSGHITNLVSEAATAAVGSAQTTSFSNTADASAPNHTVTDIRISKESRLIR